MEIILKTWCWMQELNRPWFSPFVEIGGFLVVCDRSTMIGRGFFFFLKLTYKYIYTCIYMFTVGNKRHEV